MILFIFKKIFQKSKEKQEYAPVSVVSCVFGVSVESTEWASGGETLRRRDPEIYYSAPTWAVMGGRAR